MWLFFCYTIQLITIKLYTKFQNPNPSSCWEIFDRKKSLQTDKPTDRQTNRQTNIITEKAKTIYPLYTSYRGYNQQTTLVGKDLKRMKIQIKYIIRLGLKISLHKTNCHIYFKQVLISMATARQFSTPMMIQEDLSRGLVYKFSVIPSAAGISKKNQSKI